MKHEVNNVTYELVQGDITDQYDISAIVNAANAQLRIGGGVAGAIHRKAGPELEKECRPLAPINPGEAVITSAPNLPNDHVIHTLGPVYGKDKPEDRLLANCYKNSLNIAEEEGIDSVAFPSISTGAFGFPIYKASEIAVNTILEQMQELKNVKHIRHVLFSKGDLNTYEKVLTELK